MPLSDLFKSDAEKIANELSIGYQELLDPHSRIQVKGIKELNSKKILQLGVLNHYPAILLFKNGTLLKQVIHGHENKSSLKMLIKKRLKI